MVYGMFVIVGGIDLYIVLSVLLAHVVERPRRSIATKPRLAASRHGSERAQA
jgi:hypothetical protein